MEKFREEQDYSRNPTSGCAMFSVQLLPKDKEEQECHICCEPLDEYGECPKYKCWIR